MAYVDSTFSSLVQLIGLTFDSPEHRAIRPFLTARLVGLPDGFAGIPVTFHHSKFALRVEQVLASLLRALAQSAVFREAAQYVIGVPSIWGERQRWALRCALHLAGLGGSLLMNSITAAFLGWRFLSEPGQLGELLVVVDAGDSGTTAAIARNTDGELRILGRESDPTISGFRFTGLFAQTLLAKAGEKYGIGIQAVTARARQRFLAEVRKAKENLTVNPKIRFQCTALFEGIDAVLEVTRDDLLAVVGPSLRNLSQLFAVLLRNAGVQKRAITNVLLVGGGSRLWSFQDHVVNFFKRKPQGVPAVTECIAMGLTQANAGNCKVVDILSSRIEYMLNERDRFSLFDPGTELSTRKRVSVTVARGSRVVFRTDTEQIGSLTINATGNDNQVEFIACINASGLLTVAVLPPSNGKYTAIYNAADRYQEMERQEVVFCELDAIGEARSELQAVHSELDQALMGSMLPFFDRAEFARATGLRESVSLLLEASIAGKTVHDYQSRVTEIRQLLESAKNRRRAQASFR